MSNYKIILFFFFLLLYFFFLILGKFLVQCWLYNNSVNLAFRNYSLDCFLKHYHHSEVIVWSEIHSVVSDCLWPHGLHSPWNSRGQNTGMGSLSLLQGIFPTQGLNRGLLHCRQLLYQLSHKGRPRILEWVAYTFSSGSSQTRNWTRVYCIAGGFCTNWVIREAPVKL